MIKKNNILLPKEMHCEEYSDPSALPAEPLVSVHMITYNHAPYIAQAIEGVVNQQTDFPIELLLHDDASTDGTADICMEYTRKYPNIIRFIAQEENQYSQGIRISATFQYPRARGKYLAICEGDDYWVNPEKLQMQIDFLESHPDYYLVAGATAKQKKDVVTPLEFRWNTRRTDFDVQDYICKMFFHTSTICCRNHCKKWDIPDCRILQGDQRTVLFESTPECDRIKFLDTPLSVYRDHPGGVTKLKYYQDIDNSTNSLIAILDAFDKYSKGYYRRAITYRIRELETLRSLVNSTRLLQTLVTALTNVDVLFRYFLRKWFGMRPF